MHSVARARNSVSVTKGTREVELTLLSISEKERNVTQNNNK